MIVLGIETSCDETALAVLDFNNDSKKVKILAEEVSSQINLHQLYGGVVPELAAREHLANLPILFNKVCEDAAINSQDLDLIAVTTGPGLKGCLLMGVNFAKGLSLAINRPLQAVNHIEGHIWATALNHEKLQTPFLALVVSGGHTEITLVKDFADYQIIAKTSDDAAGEAFDKSAHLLGFPYPGGAELSALADSVTASNFKLPKVMREASGFSFSGLKTAISLLIKNNQALISNQNTRAELAYAIQDSIIDALIYKLKKAIEQYAVKNIVLCGGVAANKALRSKVSSFSNCNVYIPEVKHCMDNAAMIAYVGARRYLDVKISDSSIRPRWSIDEI